MNQPQNVPESALDPETVAQLQAMSTVIGQVTRRWRANLSPSAREAVSGHDLADLRNELVNLLAMGIDEPEPTETSR